MYFRASSPTPDLHPVTRATATRGELSPHDQPLPTQPSNGNPRIRRRPILVTVCRTSSSSFGSTTAFVVWKSSAANDRPESGTARGRYDRVAHLCEKIESILQAQQNKYSNKFSISYNFFLLSVL